MLTAQGHTLPRFEINDLLQVINARRPNHTAANFTAEDVETMYRWTQERSVSEGHGMIEHWRPIVQIYANSTTFPPVDHDQAYGPRKQKHILDVSSAARSLD